MASFITKTYIKDIALLKNGKKRPSSKGTIPVFGGNGIMDYVNQHNDENAVIVGRVGAYCGCVYLCESKCWISDNAISAKAKEGTDNRFLYYLLKNLDLNHHHIGGAQPLMTQDIIGRIEVNVPSFDVQKRLADILSSLDAKIENNHKINAKLEEMAQALFKSWFIDFEPFKVGRDGSRPAFGSGNFVESELGLIPEGWKVGTIGDITTVGSGKRPPMKQSEKTSEVFIPLVGAASIMGYTNSVLYDKKILITGRVGTHGVIQRFQEACWPSDNTLVMEPKFHEFCYQILKTVDYSSLNRGSTQPLITQSDLKNIAIILPPENIVLMFEKIVSPYFEKIYNNNIENNNLAQTRDTLLPKLMSGEIEL